MRYLFLLLSLLFFKASFSQTYTVKSVPDPKDKGNFYVSNPDRILSAEEENQLNRMMDSLEVQTDNQVAIVVLNSIGEEIPKDFAVDLFKQWGIGQKGKDNGLLVLLVKDQRRVEMETGYGLEPILTDGICKRIQLDHMVPAFKEGNYGLGLINGMEAVSEMLKDPENSSIAASAPAEDSTDTSPFILFFALCHMVILTAVFFMKKYSKYFLHQTPQPDAHKSKIVFTRISQKRWLYMYLGLPLIFYIVYFSSSITFLGMAYVYIGIILIEQKIRRSRQALAAEKEQEQYHILAEANKLLIGEILILPLPFLFYYLWYRSKKNNIRNHPRNCPKCSQALYKLNENKDDAYLEKHQIKEENLKSIDYDVWLCRSCHYNEVLAFRNVSSRYSECTNCHTVAVGFLRKRTIREATYSSSGEGEKISQCKNCQKQYSERYSIPKLEYSSSSSGSSSSSSSSSGSWGGGSSGGGGSGSSW